MAKTKNGGGSDSMFGRPMTARERQRRSRFLRKCKAMLDVSLSDAEVRSYLSNILVDDTVELKERMRAAQLIALFPEAPGTDDAVVDAAKSVVSDAQDALDISQLD